MPLVLCFMFVCFFKIQCHLFFVQVLSFYSRSSVLFIAYTHDITIGANCNHFCVYFLIHISHLFILCRVLPMIFGFLEICVLK